jgi:hypothetical protein
MMAHGKAARPTPPFSGQLVRMTGEGEQVTIAFTAASPAELLERLDAAGKAAIARMLTNNAAVLAAGDDFEARQTRVYQNAVAQIRRELGMPDPPAEEENGTRADNSPGAVHAPANP